MENQSQPLSRHSDGSAGDTNYAQALLGYSYSTYRTPDPSIAALILQHLGNPKTLLNVGAGSGSYEPLADSGIQVTAVEPSETMRKQRPPYLVRAIDATSENLPFPDDHFDASMGTLTIHQWHDLEKGLLELRRVTRGNIVLMTFDPTKVANFWLSDYAPKLIELESPRFPSLEKVASILKTNPHTKLQQDQQYTVEIIPIPIPFTCTDGFIEAYYGRPERFLEEGVRRAASSWSKIDRVTEHCYVEHLKRELENGEWDRKYGHLRKLPHMLGSLVLLITKTY